LSPEDEGSVGALYFATREPRSAQESLLRKASPTSPLAPPP
jgi:hypothetical protein